MKQVASNIKIQLANYHELLDFSRFGSDLDSVTKSVLTHGETLMEVLKQKQYSPLSMEDEIIDILIAQSSMLNNIKKEDIHHVLKLTHMYLVNNNEEVFTEMKETRLLSEENKKKIYKACQHIIEGMKDE